MITRQLRISGRVQGVGYRDALRHEARRRSLTGWVRNRADGSVEALVQGTQEAVEALVGWARRGPPAADVADVRVTAPGPEHDKPYPSFERWPTA
jgi:acylphosphatase